MSGIFGVNHAILQGMNLAVERRELPMTTLTINLGGELARQNLGGEFQ